MKTIGRYLLIALVTIVMGASVVSCGARKRTATKVNITEQKDIVVTETDSVATETDLSKIVENITIEPVDPTQPNEVVITTPTDTIKIVSTNSKVTKKKEVVDSVVTTNEVKKVEVVDKTVTETKESNVNVEREAFNWKGLNWALGIFLAIAVTGLIYRFTRR